MRGAIACVFAVLVVAAAAIAKPESVSLTAADLSYRYAIASVQPARGAVVGVAHPVVVTFKEPITDFGAAERAIGIKTTPARTGRYEWTDDHTVQWVPDRYWPAHTTVALSAGNQTAAFDTGPAVVGVASISKHTFTVTVDGVEAGPPSSLPAPHHRPFWGQQGVFPASLGRPEYPTPVDTYTVLAKERSITMDSSSVGIPVTDPDGYLITVDYAVRITSRGLFVHSAPWAVNALGYENVSHGCISLSPEDAEWYYNTVNVGDPVIVED